MIVETIDTDGFLAVADDGPSEIEDFGELVTLANIFESAGIIFGGEKIIAVLEEDAFAHVFEGISVGPADADGFFGEGNGLLLLSMDCVFGEDPINLMFHEVL